MEGRIGLAAVLLLVVLSGCTAEQKSAEFLPLETTIAHVIDGDTIITAGGEHVRLIGINSTERGKECYEEADEKLRALVLGKNVWLEMGEELRDKYGRMLAYVYVGDEGSGTFINMEMVKGGWAYAYPYKPNTKFAHEFAAAEESARKAGAGCLWGN